MVKKFLSRKLIAMIFGTVIVPVLLQYGVPQDTVNWLVGLIAAYVSGQALVDAAAAKAVGAVGALGK